jgi:hypothetical protein
VNEFPARLAIRDDYAARRAGVTVRTLIAALLFAATADAETVTLCLRLSDCPPPASFAYTSAAVPFNAPVRFGGAVGTPLQPIWLWIKTGEPSRPCGIITQVNRRSGAKVTAHERDIYSIFRPNPCDARIGDVLFSTPPIRVTP